MSNYNIEIDLMKIEGAKLKDILYDTQVKRCVCLPIDNEVGTITDALSVKNEETGEIERRSRRGVILKLTAFALPDPVSEQSHLIKPAYGKTMYQQLSPELRRLVPWVGNLRPWEPKGK